MVGHLQFAWHLQLVVDTPFMPPDGLWLDIEPLRYLPEIAPLTEQFQNLSFPLSQRWSSAHTGPMQRKQNSGSETKHRQQKTTHPGEHLHVLNSHEPIGRLLWRREQDQHARAIAPALNGDIDALFAQGKLLIPEISAPGQHQLDLPLRTQGQIAAEDSREILTRFEGHVAHRYLNKLDILTQENFFFA